MTLTNDQYYGLSRLSRWYSKYQQQVIEVSGIHGTGIWDLIQSFIEHSELDPREIMYLSHNQKQVLELAYLKYHSYYVNGIIYKYTRMVDYDSIPILNYHSQYIEYEWKKEVRKKIDKRYKLIVVFDSILLNHQTLKDLLTFGIPIILLKDPMLLPAPDTYTFLRDSNIELHDIHEKYLESPINHFIQKIIHGEKLKYGNYDSVSVVPRKQVNIYNIRSSDMNITLSQSLRDEVNNIYQSKIMNKKNIINVLNERLIVMDSMYNQVLINPDNNKVKVYLTKGLIGSLSKINKHALNTKYVPINFLPEFYHESFQDMSIDRHYLNGIDLPSTQIIPDYILKTEYAYALTPSLARLSHWDKVTLIIDSNDEEDEVLQKMLLYTAITRARKSLSIII